MNLELGAGHGKFGKLYFPSCLLTDINRKFLIAGCLDCLCNAYKLPFTENSFEVVIMCNPYGYGFKTAEDAEILLKELTRILKRDSKIIIISNHKNRYCAPQRVEKRIKEISLQATELNFHIVNIAAHNLYKGHAFLTADGNKTIPTRKITIDVTKK